MVTREGFTYQRYCPHMGEDLKEAKIVKLGREESGYIVCPRHSWTWDLRDGRCVNGGSVPLKVGAQ